MAAAAGLPLPDNVHGHSQLPVVAGERDGVRDHVYGQLTLRNGRHEAVFDGRWKLVQYADTAQLFDLQTDPRERHNVIDEAPEQVDRLRAQLARDAALR
jgi:arylsulfatase A-like enzyme